MCFRNGCRVLTALVLLAQGACTAWSPVPGTELAPRLAEARVVRITRDDATRVVIHQPRVEGDSVLGWSGRLAENAPRPVSVPTARVAEVEARHFSGERTALAAVTGVIVAGLALLALVAATFPST